MTEENLERVHELTQRTNQMNFSGNRYDREVLRKLLASPYLDTFVLSCEDRFGSYGVIGFSIVDRREPRMTDLMFSCRIQSKRVEHAFLASVIRRYIAETGKDFYANYRKTPRNAPSGQVFSRPCHGRDRNPGRSFIPQISQRQRSPGRWRHRCGDRRGDGGDAGVSVRSVWARHDAGCCVRCTGEVCLSANRGPIVSFSFDDFPRTAYSAGGAILERFGVRGTYYAAAGLMNTANELGEQFRLRGSRFVAGKGP